jgi:hypothetical protein
VLVSAALIEEEVAAGSISARRGAHPLGAHLREPARRLRGVLRPQPATGDPVDIGEAVGVVAAQSIGELTQLTLRTFHRWCCGAYREQTQKIANYDCRVEPRTCAR